MKSNNMRYTILRWDSKQFGYKVARLDDARDAKSIEGTFQHLKEHNVRLVYWFVDPKDVYRNQAAKKYHGTLVDEKVTYSRDTHTGAAILNDVSGVRSYRGKTVNNTLLSLALQSGVYSRFSTDAHFTHGEYIKLYSVWIQKSVRRILAFDVLVYLDSDKTIRGFITLEKVGVDGHIGLLAVDRNFRGKSIGKMLIMKAFVCFAKRGYKRVLVTTQGGNVAACKYYEKLGFKRLKTVNVYHFWL